MFELLGMFVLQALLVKNPTLLLFKCPDHALDTDHVVDIIEVASTKVIQTLNVGDPPLNTEGDVEVKVNVQPVAFGTYTFRVRALAGTISSVDSEASPNWERAPGKPTTLVVK